MIVYWVLLLTTALFAYLIGSLDTLVLASNFVFHRNLRRWRWSWSGTRCLC